MDLWTVYRHPSDRISKYVARRWVADGSPAPIATDELVEADTLEGVRAKIPDGLTCFARSENDDPVIVETWL